uniref:Uncharacterized protein n=1 Tax=Rhipicephalus microplus TaxID=6941 RepID=A0A6G5AGM9_RHIMP
MACWEINVTDRRQCLRTSTHNTCLFTAVASKAIPSGSMCTYSTSRKVRCNGIVKRVTRENCRAGSTRSFFALASFDFQRDNVEAHCKNKKCNIWLWPLRLQHVCSQVLKELQCS